MKRPLRRESHSDQAAVLHSVFSGNGLFFLAGWTGLMFPTG
jgi:hypothetical protein